MEFIIAGQVAPSGNDRAGAEGQDRSGVGSAGAAVHPERGKQPAQAGAGHHRRAGGPAPQELLGSSGDPGWVGGWVEMRGGWRLPHFGRSGLEGFQV